MAKKQKKSVTNKIKGEKLYEFLLAKGKEFAKQLSKNPTKWELILKKHFSDLHYNFKFQVPVICAKKKLYILDFLLTDFNLVVEVDGISCHSSKKDVKSDNMRTKLLKKEGYHVLRLWNKQVSTFTQDQIDTIIKTKIKLLTNPNEV